MSIDEDQIDEAAWCAEERATVANYLDREGVEYRGIGDWPAWHVMPYAAIWAIESKKRPGWVGWWAISGDLPTDYVPVGPDRHPREGMRDIAVAWQRSAPAWSKGQRDHDITMGDADTEAALAPLLAERAEVLLEWVADDSLWTD